MGTSAGTGTGTSAVAGILDAGGLQRLRDAAREHSPGALKSVATQFEALFLDMVMKSMRDAAPAEGLMDNEQGRMMQGMLDQQYSKALAARGIGLADVLIRQMSRWDTAAAAAVTADQATDSAAAHANTRHSKTNHRYTTDASTGSASADGAALSGAATQMEPSGKSAIKRGFIERMMSHAEAISIATGIPARFMLAHAALESGWGRREIRNPDGSQSHNIFGIKADAHWKGKVTEVATTEYLNGVPQSRIERFRSYDAYADAFADYAKTLTGSARYRAVLASASDAHGFAQGLQQAGYATDPLYAQKLSRVIARL